jgi:hypothetical protein
MSGRFSELQLGRWVGLASVAALLAVGCQPAPDRGPAESPATVVSSALSGLTSANLQLQVSKNACAANVAQDYFKVTNGTGAALPLSQIAIRYWVNDTSAANIVPAVFYGGCVTTPNGTCVHPVTGVTASATRFSPACGSDPNHQASWEVTVTTSDTTALAAGQTWGNIQTAVNLANHANFAPGTATWFSGCGVGKPYAADPSFAVYDNGDLVQTGVAVPICRAPAQVQTQAFIDATYYAASDIRSSFMDGAQQIDCIDFAAQHSVKAWKAAGVTIPTTAPAAPVRPGSMDPPNVSPGFGYTGQPDVNGHAESCASGQVPVSRPTVAQIQAAGGVAAFVQAQASRNRLMAGMQDPAEHDCWLNTAPGNGDPIGTPNAVDWEHAAGVQTTGFLPASANGFFGAHTITPIYAPFTDPAGPSEHTDSQFWVQSGNCEDWYASPTEIANHQNQCQTGSACTSCTGASCAQCAVQSLEVASFVQQGAAPDLAVFFTTDGYFERNCFAGNAKCTGCPTTTTQVNAPGATGTLTEGTDCFVAWPGALTKPNATLAVNTSGPGGSQYGVAPNEVEFEVWNGAGTPTPGWWIYVNKNLIGWFPPATFNWSDGTPGPLSNGPATYLQAGGEVFDSWAGGAHTATSMVSDNAAQSGYEFAAYHRSMGYYDATQTFHDTNLAYGIAPASEDDDGIPGVCGLHSGGWTDAAGEKGAYTLSTTTPAGGAGWGQYVYFGGGRLAHEIGPTASPVTIKYHQYAACTGFPNSMGITSVGPNAAYVVFQLESIDNSGNNVPFKFDQSKLFVTDPHDGLSDFVDPFMMIYSTIFGPFAAANVNVSALGSVSYQADPDIALVVTTSSSDGSVEANQTSYTLQYQQQPGDPPVTLVKTNASQTTFAPPGQADCAAIGLTL